MKKSLKILIVGIIAFVVILVAAVAVLVGKMITYEKDPVTFEEFGRYAEEQGYLFEDGTDQMPEGFGKYGAAYKDGNQELVIAFSECSDPAEASKLYNRSKNMIIEEKASVSSNINVSLKNYSKYEQTSGGIYAAAARIDNTVLYVQADSEEKEELQEFIKGLGY